MTPRRQGQISRVLNAFAVLGLIGIFEPEPDDLLTLLAPWVAAVQQCADDQCADMPELEPEPEPTEDE